MSEGNGESSTPEFSVCDVRKYTLSLLVPYHVTAERRWYTSVVIVYNFDSARRGDLFGEI